MRIESIENAGGGRSNLAMGGIGAALVLALGWTLTRRMSDLRHFVPDDAYITYLYGRNLAEGHGLRFNPLDESPTEGFSSLLHVLLCALAEAADVDPLIATRAAGLLLLLSVPIVAAFALARPLARSPAELMLASACVLTPFFLLPETGKHLASGMETIVFATLQAWTFVWAARIALGSQRVSLGNWTAGFALCALLSIARPEGVLLAAGQFVIAVAARLWYLPASERVAFCRRAGMFAGVCSVAGATFLGWKLVYFGQLLPNAYYVKSHNAIFGNADELLPGVEVLTSFALNRYLPAVALLLLLLLGLRGRERMGALVALLLPSALVTLLYARAIHEVAFGYRYEYGQLLPLALGGVICLALLRLRSRLAFASICTLLVACASLLYMTAEGIATSPLRGGPRVATSWLAVQTADVQNDHVRLGRDLARTGLGQKATLLTGSAGMIPYHSRFYAIDWAGLNTPYLSGRTPRSIEEVSEYLDAFEADVFMSPLPPATKGHSSRHDDPAYRSRTVQGLFDWPKPSLFNAWDRELLQRFLYWQMSLIRDEYTLGAKYGSLFVWLRRDSPHAAQIRAQLKRS